MEITIKDLWKVLKKSIVLVLACALLFGLVFYVYTQTRVPKVYQSSAKYFLGSQAGSDATGILGTTELNSNLVVGSKHIATMGEVLMTEETMTQVLRFVEQWSAQNPEDDSYKLSRTYTPAALVEAFTFVGPTKDETKLTFTVRCRAYSPEDSRILLDAFGNIINERVQKDVLQGLYVVKNIEAPKTGAKISPNVMTNTLLGCVIGAVLPYAFFLVLAILDTRIKSEEDIKNKFSYPVLGQIPRL